MTLSRLALIVVMLLTVRTASAACGGGELDGLASDVLGLAAVAGQLIPKPVCEHGVQKVVSCDASNYGVGDGFANQPVACGDQTGPASKKLHPKTEQTLAIKVSKKGGFFNKKKFCGKTALVTYKGQTLAGIVTDSGGLTPSRCVDLSWLLAKNLHILSAGSDKVKVEFCK